MKAPDLQFMVHSQEVVKDGVVHKGSSITPLEPGKALPPEWQLRDFGFAAFSGAAVPGLREVHFGRKSIWAFPLPHEHCEEVAVFRRGTDTKRRWDGDELKEPKIGLDMFFVTRMRQITEDTPLSKQFNGEWGFWESFFVPIIDEEQTMEALAEMGPAQRESHFAKQRLPVTCRKCPEGQEVLTIPEDMVVRYEVRVSCKDIDEWGDLCNKIGEDMILQFPCILDGKPLAPGCECTQATSEIEGRAAQGQLKKRDFEQLKLPVHLTFECDMNVAAEWRPDGAALTKKFDALGEQYVNNLMNGWSFLCRLGPDPWSPMSRLAANALSKVLAKYPSIRSVLDVGCGDMAWNRYVIKDHPELKYVGVDILPFPLSINFRRCPKMQFVCTDLANERGIEVMPQGCDLVIAKEVFNQMPLPDAVAALRRVIKTRPRFLLTHIHGTADNTGWEARIEKHLEYTPYDYNKSPFSLPYPVTEVQRISEDDCFVLYQITPDSGEGVPPPPAMVELLEAPVVGEDLEIFATVADGEWTEPKELEQLPAPAPGLEDDDEDGEPHGGADELGPKPAGPVAGGPSVEEGPAMPPPKPIKGIPAAEFRARCDLIFEKFDQDKDDVLNFEELVALMDSGGRRIEEYDAYAGLCKRLGCDARVGLTRKDVYKLFEKAPQAVWEEIYRSINPLAQMVKKGAEQLPSTFLQRPLPNFIFDDSDETCKVVINFNDHLFFGAAEVAAEEHVQAYFGKQRLEVHVCAPGSNEAKDLYLWKLVVTPLTAEIVPEDCKLEYKRLDDRIGSIKDSKITVRLVKSKKKKWRTLGQASTGQRI